MFWFGLILGVALGVAFGNNTLRSIILRQSKIKVVPNGKDVAAK